MDLEVRLTRDVLSGLLRQFAPIRLHLTPGDEDRRWVELEQPDVVELIPDVGLRIASNGRLRYKLAGLSLPLTIRRVELVLAPKVLTPAPDDFRLAFELRIENADLELVPGLVDQALSDRINEVLRAEKTPLVWDFGKTFNKSVRMPERLEPLSHLLLSAKGGQIRVDRGVVTFRVALGASLSRSKERPTDD